ncbi:HAMP domain-containing sensor histidine kinase [Serpentinicella sp. ANB-PHB4]|uniref:sensor histidine kinase n=1 Tax=Serpentinicella sp. ANB-PHB4 TaxID=3074076 RepID=UPI0028675C8A|nr:HAMP domain-containing sensor histidine kinase [Serpentinicella sp. ANB-PHB4]MDR5658413.1 HAMP domain-containing sensor histidine kinase [Serpentinicella sp. ANB-PHB4]
MNKISRKLILGMIAFTSLTIIILWVYQSVYLEKYYMKSKLDHIRQAVENTRIHYEEENMLELQEYAEKIFYTHNISIEVSYLNGQSLFISGHMKGRGQLLNNKIFKSNYLKEIIETGEITNITQYNRLNTDVLTYSKLITDAEYIITGSIPIEPINETIEILQKQLITISFILFIIAIIIGTLISKVFLKPIQKLNQSVKAMKEGNMNVRVDVTTSDEIGTLSKNFNSMTEQLLKVDKLKKDLIANVSHELRTPLGLIQGYAELIRDINGENKEKRDENLNVIIEETNRLSRVVDNILDFSQIQSGYLKLQKEVFNITDLIKNTIDKYKLIATQKEIKLILEYSGGKNNVYGDYKRIEQVVHNLVSNALEHTHAGGKIKITITEESQGTKVQIQDTGVGISNKELQYIWNRHYKCSHNSNRGTGLGLSIVKSILEAHEIPYGVDSEVGKGSTFYFTISKKLVS